METEIIQLLQNVSWATDVALFTYYILRPLILMLINKTTPQNGRLDKLEKKLNNDSEHRFQSIEQRLTRLECSFGDLREKIGKLEGKINGRTN